MALTLADCPIGQTVMIKDFQGETSRYQRLFEMGILNGTAILVIGRAPLGDPLQLEVRGTRLTLRLADARQILVETSP